MNVTSEDAHNLNDFYYQLLHERSKTHTRPEKVTAPTTGNNEPRVRVHQEGILEISGTSLSPVKINVKAGPVGIVGTIEVTKRDETNTRWFFRAENIREDQNVWDDKGRAVLVPGKVSCQVIHRSSITDYKQAGLNLGVDSPIVSFGMSTSTEKVLSEFYEGEDNCPIGEVAPFTTQKEIEQRCKKCLGRVLETIRQDVQSRLNHLSYFVQAPGCKDDSACYREDTAWTVGRCVLIKDKNESHYTDCRARASVGGACRGAGSRGLFEYTCDKGLACIKVHASSGLGDYNRYECRNPKNPRFKGPLLPGNRDQYALAWSDLELIGIALEKYFKNHQKFPSTSEGLEALISQSGDTYLVNTKVVSGIRLPPTDPYAPFAVPYLYVSDGIHYKVISVGPDRKANTSDDIVLKK